MNSAIFVLACLSVLNFNYVEMAEIFLIDSDAGIDDAIALSLMLEADRRTSTKTATDQEIKILAITSVHGNTGVDNVTMNIQTILKKFNRTDIPVYRGTDNSIKKTPPSDNYFGYDGFGDVYKNRTVDRLLLQKKHAVQAMIDYAYQYKNELNILCLGPLTNIGMAIRLDVNFLSMVKKVYILGGSIHALGNIHPGQEFNMYVDPEAAYILFDDGLQSNNNVTQLGIEPINSLNFTESWRINTLGVLNSTAIHLLNVIQQVDFTSKHMRSNAFSDAVLAAYVIRPKIVTSIDTVPIEILTEGDGRGVMLIDYGNLTASNKVINSIQELNTTDVYATLIDYLS